MARRKALLLATLLVSLVGGPLAILAMLEAGPFAQDEAEPPPKPIVIAIVDGAGRPVPHADTWLLQKENDESDPGTWDAETGTLTLPPSDAPRGLLVVARGFRIHAVDSVVGDATISLEMGHALRVEIAGPADPPTPPLHMMLRVNPVAIPEDAPGARVGLRMHELVDLMAVDGARDPIFARLPCEKFGFAVSVKEAEQGLLMPLPGEYRVQWGLIDLEVGTWFTLGDRHGTLLEIVPGLPPPTFSLHIEAEDVARTLAGLRERIDDAAREAAAAEEEAAGPR